MQRMFSVCVAVFSVSCCFGFLWSPWAIALAPQDKAPPAVIDRLAAGQPQELLVLFEYSAIKAEAARLRKEAGLPFDDANIIAFKAGKYAELKQRVLRDYTAPLEQWTLSRVRVIG